MQSNLERENVVKSKSKEEDQPLTLGMMKTLLSLQSDSFKTELNNTEARLKKHSDEKFNNIQNDVNCLKNQLKEKDDEIRQLRLDNERQKRHKNIILHNIPESGENNRALKVLVISIILNECQVDIQNHIDAILRIGKKLEGKHRPILVALTSFDKKMEVMWNKKLNNSKIQVFDDFCKEDSEERKRLVPIMMSLRNLNYKNVHLKLNKLFVNGSECNEEVWTQLIADRQPTEIQDSSSETVANEVLNRTKPTASYSGNKVSKSADKRGRASSDEEGTPSKAQKKSGNQKTTIIGIDQNKRRSIGKNPIIEALKKQQALNQPINKTSVSN